MQLSDNALFVLRKRYLKNGETPEERFHEVARVIASPEIEAARYEGVFFNMMDRLDFLPNTPTIANAGRSGQLAACFVLPIQDSLTTPEGDGILDTARWTGLIHQTGGGTGFDFSRLRGEGMAVRSSNGVASGPVSFIQLIDSVTQAIKQGGIRRGANMAILRIDHPDIEKFIDAKITEGQLVNFNISVAVTDEFMARLERGDPEAIRLWSRIYNSAWTIGDPGVIFIDRMNASNPLYPEYPIRATNPCGEIPMPDWDACNLGSINLANFVEGDEFDFQRFFGVVTNSIRFLDNVVTMNKTPVPAIDKMTRLTRRIGLGVMGWADLLVRLKIPYDSPEALNLADKIAERLKNAADLASRYLAHEKGPYPLSKDRKYRNVARLSIAPTGSIALIANTSPSIEPHFAKFATHEGALGKIDIAYPDSDKPWFRTAMKIDPAVHVMHQAVWQRYIDNGVSKTINMNNTMTPDDVKHVYELAYRQGCKGITIYRNGSRGQQVYNEVEDPSCRSGVCAI